LVKLVELLVLVFGGKLGGEGVFLDERSGCGRQVKVARVGYVLQPRLHGVRLERGLRRGGRQLIVGKSERLPRGRRDPGTRRTGGPHAASDRGTGRRGS